MTHLPLRTPDRVNLEQHRVLVQRHIRNGCLGILESASFQLGIFSDAVEPKAFQQLHESLLRK